MSDQRAPDVPPMPETQPDTPPDPETQGARAGLVAEDGGADVDEERC